MKLTDSNLIIKKHGDCYCLAVLIPDNSFNYIHSQNLTLRKATYYRNQLLVKPSGISYINTEIVEDETYYRIEVSYTFYKKTGYREYSNEHDITLKFHSRKLNLTDAIIEYDLLLNGERD